MVRRLSRRVVVAGLAGAAAVPELARAETVLELEWPDLLPNGAPPVSPVISTQLDHDLPATRVQQPPSSGLRTDLNGKTVRLPGYIVPLDYKGTGVVAFLLVPFVGACVHVPPPPANQLVLVTSNVPYETKGLFEAVYVTGMFGAASVHTQVAEVGYALSADKIEPYSA